MVVLSLVAMLAVAAAPASAQVFDDVDLDDNFFDGQCVVIDGFIICDDNFDDDFFDPDFDGFAAGPAAQEFELEDVESGDVEPVVDISNAGDNANLAPTVLQSANSGNVQNAQGVTLTGSEVDDVEFEGSSIEIGSSVESDVTQTIQQSAAASR